VTAPSTRSVPVGQIRPLGDLAVLVGVAGPTEAAGLTRVLAASGIEGLVEAVGGMATVLVAFDPDREDLASSRERVADLVRRVPAGPTEPQEAAPPLVIACTFDGPDLDEVAERAGCPPEQVIALLTAHPLTVSVVGFSPGFAYLAGLPDALSHVPRRARPRPSVPAGSVALANGHAAVYPTASPGGWQLIGRTDEPLFTPWAPPYARLAPGDRVRFTTAIDPPADGSSPIGAEPPPTAGPVLPASARPVFVVEEPGLRTALQDGGRRGVASLGVPAAGPADPHSFWLANRLVGNPGGAGALEAVARGPTLRCLSPAFVAVLGGSPDLRLQGQVVPTGRVLPVNPGQELRVGPVTDGFRAYVAIAGGFVGPEVMGSCASDQLSGLGPGPIERGARLWAAPLTPPLGDHLLDELPPGASADDAVALRVVPGPHPERFATGAFASLSFMQFTVTAESNRVGLRLSRTALSPPIMMARGVTAELDSQGTVTGVVQVPPDGDPVVLLSDHATLGGYPVLAVVAWADHGLLGQCAPGASVVLVPIDHAAADRARQARLRFMASAVVGRYPLGVE
jgi:KipI family sensor histidine kinase inhibitor